LRCRSAENDAEEREQTGRDKISKHYCYPPADELSSRPAQYSADGPKSERHKSPSRQQMARRWKTSILAGFVVYA